MNALWTTAELIEATGGRLDEAVAVTGISIDTCTLVPGELFVALQGESDGHAYVEEGFARGAAAAMVHQDAPGGPLLRVDDTQAALGRMGAFGRMRFAGRVAAITGSVGKTTTKEMLRCILAAQGPTHAAVALYNNHWGVPLTLAKLPRDAAFCVAEIGMNHAGEIEPLSRLTRPHVAVITAVEKAHIGHLGSLEAIADEKAAVLRGLEPGGLAVLPADSPMLPRLLRAAEGTRVMTFGATAGADARLVSCETDADGTSAVLLVAGDTVSLRMGAPGRHMAVNALAAVTAAAALGVSPQRSATALAGFAPVAGRGARRSIAVRDGEALLLDESYNGNGASMRAALSVLSLLPGRRIAVLGDMLELGDAAEEEHISLARAVSASADLLFCCGPMMRLLYDAVPAVQRGAHAPDLAALSAMMPDVIRPGDAILVKGSLGSRMKLVAAMLDRLAETA